VDHVRDDARTEVRKCHQCDREGARGDTTDNVITFRMRWFDGVTLENRVTYHDQPFKIMTIKEIGRHVGLDVTCERVGL